MREMEARVKEEADKKARMIAQREEARLRLEEVAREQKGIFAGWLVCGCVLGGVIKVEIGGWRKGASICFGSGTSFTCDEM